MDRVELAYLHHLKDRPEPLFCLIRTTLGYVLLDPTGTQAVANRLVGITPWGVADRLSILARGKSETLRRAESDLRRVALARCRPRNLTRMMARHLPPGIAYLNTGHSNLTDRVVWALRHGAKARIAVLIHDTIPLDFPQYQRRGTPERFRAMLKRAQRADLLIYNSNHSRARAQAHMDGPPPASVVAHLGVEQMIPDPAAIPDGLTVTPPYFVTLGTIEPRKRHDLLLDVWDDFAREDDAPPGLLILGARGWNNAAVFDRLDRLPPDGPVREIAGLSDAAVAALLRGSSGLLFPSEAEGYGLPPIEAAALGVPVICRDLAVYREVLGDIPVYLKETDRYLWRNSIKSLARGRTQADHENSARDFNPPTWEDHFNAVLRST